MHQVNDCNGEVFSIYKKRFQKGEKLDLNELAINIPCPIAAQPASNTKPAYDLKPVIAYKAINAKCFGPGIEKGQVDGKNRVIFQKASAENALEFNFAVGVADMYSLTISYNNPGSENVNGKLQLLSPNGALLIEEEIVFTPTRPEKLNYITTNTGTMINAGTYKLRVTSKDAEGVSINSLNVQ